jgi:LacI family transcriptional regulator
VALLVETSREVGRGILRGVLRYERLHGPWGLHVMPGDLEQTLPAMRAWGGNGIIARITTPEITKAILATELPAIAVDLWEDQLAPGNPLSRLPELYVDSYAVGRMAAEHLLELGLSHFAYVGELHNVLWSKRRENGYADRLRLEGFEPLRYAQPDPCDRDWGREQRRLSRWLAVLPKPVGLFAAMDVRGRQVLEACLEAEIAVPEEVAVLGVDNDELLCELSEPPMSSVSLDAERGGYEAAALLDRIWQGNVGNREKVLIEPTHVVARHSTDVCAVADRDVAAALKFVRLNATRPISVHDVVRHIGLSRRVLEVRFRRAVKRTIHDEIARLRLEQVKLLLRETNWSIGRIAESAAFANGSYLGKWFRQHVDLTPAEYREQQTAGRAPRAGHSPELRENP